MILIFVTTESAQQVQQSIAKEHRLDELVTLNNTDETEDFNAAPIIVVKENGIAVLPDWCNNMPPLLFAQPLAYSDDVLLGIVFCLLNNFEKSYAYLQQHPAALATVDLFNCLLNQVEMQEELTYSATTNHYSLHNKAIAYQYGNWQPPKTISAIQQAFETALASQSTPVLKAFTIKHFGTFLNDIQQPAQSVAVVEQFLQTSLPHFVQMELKTVLCNAWMQQLTVPYDTALLEKLKTTLWECLQHYENNQRHAEAALMLIDASQVANISNSFTESLGYINKAIGLLKEEQLTGLLGNAQYRKGMLLYTWAQNGQPQFYRTAMQAMQEALQVFTREEAPDVFADIHHHLGVIYSEIQDEVKKKAVWAAVSVASFTEALNYYNKVDFPYEFAMICHNFGNGYTKYPAALHSDNYDKALAWYREALDIRTATHYPLERCNTLYNYLDASWLAANPNEALNEERFNDMWAIAHELLKLTSNDELKAEVALQIRQLDQLKESFGNNGKTEILNTING